VPSVTFVSRVDVAARCVRFVIIGVTVRQSVENNGYHVAIRTRPSFLVRRVSYVQNQSRRPGKLNRAVFQALEALQDF
jgi:hypothetical protein